MPSARCQEEHNLMVTLVAVRIAALSLLLAALLGGGIPTVAMASVFAGALSAS